jgi:arsenate reductase
MDITIYHNPRCSKSRQTLQLLEDNGHQANIVEYLKTPPSADTLGSICQALGMSPKELLRKGESEYKEQGFDNPELSDQQLLDLMVQFPKVIQRPIVVAGNNSDNQKAAIGRPPESVLEILS